MINMVSLRNLKWQFDSLFIKKTKALITTVTEIIYLILLLLLQYCLHLVIR